MLTLTYGYKKPQTNDKGPIVFPAMEGNIQQLNDHSHNGADSTLLTTASVVGINQTILSGAWALVANGIYKQTVTLPGSLLYDKIHISHHASSTGHLLYLTVEKVSANSYDVYINDNTLGLLAVYT